VLAFTVDVPEAVLEDLQRRLERTRWPDDLDGGDRAYGPGVAFMAALVEHWRTRFDWRAHERALNQVPQFIEAIDGTRIHFAHLRGRGPAPLPVVITHGWPGSFVEMLESRRSWRIQRRTARVRLMRSTSSYRRYQDSVSRAGRPRLE
jgi:hypothetical protein